MLTGALPVPPAATPGTGLAAAQTLPAECHPVLNVQRASVTAAGVQGNDTSFDPSTSANGGHVAYSTFSSTLAPGDTNNTLDSYVTNLSSGAVTRASVGVDGAQANASAVSPAINGDGSQVAFYSDASNLIGGDGNAAANYFTTGFTYMPFGMLAVNPTTTLELWFRTTSNGPIVGYSNTTPDNAPTQWVPVLYVGTDGKLRGQFWNGAANPLTSTNAVNDGRWHHAVLTTFNGIYQFLYVDGVNVDFRAGQVNHLQMFNATIGRGHMTNYPSGGTGWRTFGGDIDEVAVYWGDYFDQPIVSAHYQARTTNYLATALANTPNGYWRLDEPVTNTTAADASGSGNNGSYAGTVGRGRQGALTVDQNAFTDVFVRNLAAPTTERISVNSDGVEANRESLFPDLSPDGRYVAFNSSATNLVPGDTNARSDIFVRDRQTGQTTRVSVSSAGVQGNNGSNAGVISADGRYVAFNSSDTNLVAGDTNGRGDIFVRDRQTNQTTRVSTSSAGAQANDDSLGVDISADGRYVTFYSFATNLVPSDTNAVADVFVKDLQTGALTRVNLGPGGVQAAGASSFFPSISGNGRYVAFTTSAANLATGDTNGASDVFVHDRTTGQTRRASTSGTGAQANGSSDAFSDGVLSDTGLQIAYGSNATNLITGDTNARTDVYVADYGVVEGTEVDRFIDLWLPRLDDEPFLQSLLDIVGYPLEILDEGFHDLTQSTQELLARCLASVDIDNYTIAPELHDAFLDYLASTLYTLIFDKDNLGGNERVGDILDGALDNPVLDELTDTLLAPLPPGRLPNLLAPGPLTSGALLGGDLLFDADPVAGIGDTLEAFAPALPPLPNLTDTLQGLSGALSELEVIPFLFNLIGQVTYSVRVERFADNGAKLGEFTENGNPVCTPRTLSSVDGSISLPTEHDLRVGLCPDFLTFLGGADQQVAITADALSPGVRVRITFTIGTLLAGFAGQLQTIVDASTSGLPVETGAGSTAAFPCNQNSVPPLLPPLVGETHEGFCVQLKANGADPANGTNVITTYSSAPVTGVSVHLNSTASGTPVPVGQVEIRNVPDANAHTLTITAQQPSALNGNEVAARVALTNAEPAVVNPDEDILVRQYEDGTLAAALSVTDVPDALDATLTAPLDDTGAPTAIDVTGSAEASALTEYTLEQYTPGGARTAHLRITGFAPAFTYALSIVHDDQLDADVGLAVTGQFAQGPPTGGELYLQDTTRGAELLVRDFATATTFTAQVDNPADPHRFNLALTNSENHPAQIVRVVQEPAGGTPIRLLLAGAAADPAEFPDPATGQTLRWTAIPRSLTLEAELTDQPNGDPGAVRFDITASDAPTDGAIELRDHQPAETLVLTVLSPSTAQHLLITAQGPLSNPSRVRIERDNTTERPSHGLQLAVLDAGGVRAQLTFAGAAADTGRLIPGPARDIDAIATNVASQAFAYELDIEPGAGSIPAAATITGTNSPTGTGMDVVIVDSRSDLRLHQHNLPTAYTYVLRTETDPTTGQIARATIDAVNQSTPMPDGLLELSFGNLDAVFAGFTQTFVYDFVVDGPLDSPDAVTIDIAQSATNPNLLIQLAKAVTGSTADFSATLRNSAQPSLPLTGRNADLLFVGIPQNLTLGLTIDQTAANRLAASIGIDAHGTDLPDSTLRIRRTDGPNRQELRFAGLAPEMSTFLTLDGPLSAPRRATVEAYRTIVHPTDVVQLIVYETGQLAQRVELRATPVGHQPPGTGDEPGPVPGVAGIETNVDFRALPEGLVLEQTVCENLGATDSTCVDGDRSVDGRERLGLLVRTFDAGPSLANPLTPIRTGARVDATLNNAAAQAEARVLTLFDLPAEVQVRYLGPRPDPGPDDNCIGDIAYTASDAGLDLRLRQFMGPVHADNGDALGDGCFPDSGPNPTAGPLTLDVIDMPSLGFETAALHRDGSALFRTHGQPVGRARVIAPVPDWVAAFVNRDLTGGDAIDEALCLLQFGCMYTQITTNPQFVNLQLTVDATGLSDTEVRTNIGPNGDPKPQPPGADQVNRLLWGLLPILGVRNTTGTVVVQLGGDDDPTQTNSMDVRMRCCVRGIPTETNHLTLSFDIYARLQVAFYGWDAVRLLDPGGGVVKYNRDGEEVGSDLFGSQVVLKVPGTGDTPVPFGPRFIEYHLGRQPGTYQWDPASSNLFAVPADTTSYFLPNLYEAFGAQPVVEGDPNDVRRQPWYFRAHVWQTNWYWYVLLHLLQPDPLGFYP